jgi:hypothetical protein
LDLFVVCLPDASQIDLQKTEDELLQAKRDAASRGTGGQLTRASSAGRASSPSRSFGAGAHTVSATRTLSSPRGR